MGLITVEELENAMGTTFSDAQAGQATYLIDGLSAYIETKSGITFGVVTGSVERFEANQYGRIELSRLPVTAVTTVHDYQSNTDLDPNNWYWDGLKEIRGFYGYQVVDVTYSYGQAPGADVKWAATEAIKRGMYSGNANPNLRTKQVGDVIYEYAGMLPLSDAELEVFAAYGTPDWTVRLDPSVYPHRFLPWFPFDASYEDPDEYWQSW